MKLIIMQFLHSPVTSSLFGPNILLSTTPHRKKIILLRKFTRSLEVWITTQRIDLNLNLGSP
jgi:hypothetical protein